MNKTISLCVWDWNGTLIDDTWLCVDTLNEMLGGVGLPVVTTDSYRKHFTFPAVNYYDFLGFPNSRENFPEISRQFMMRYGERAAECDLREGTREVLDMIQQLGVRQTIVSASPIGAIEIGLKHFGIEGFFDYVGAQTDNFAHGKVETGLRLMQDLGVNPDETLFVGDTDHDYEVAKAMGVDCVLVSGGHQSVERLQQCGVPVLNNFEELAGFFQNNR